MKVLFVVLFLIISFVAGYVTAFGVRQYNTSIGSQYALMVEVRDSQNASNHLGVALRGLNAIYFDENHSYTSSEWVKSGILKIYVPLNTNHDSVKVFNEVYDLLKSMNMLEEVISVSITKRSVETYFNDI